MIHHNLGIFFVLFQYVHLDTLYRMCAYSASKHEILALFYMNCNLVVTKKKSKHIVYPCRLYVTYPVFLSLLS